MQRTFLVMCVLMAGGVCGQDPPGEPPTKPASGNTTEVPKALKAPVQAGPVEELNFGPIIVKDGSDDVMLPGVSLKDYADLLQQAKNRLPAAPPAYSLEQVELTGVASHAPALATFQVRLQIRLTDNSTVMRDEEDAPVRQIVRVPIGMGSMVLRQLSTQLKYEGEGSARVEYAPAQRQYICVIEGEEASAHSIGFEAACSIKPDRTGHRMSLELPSAPALVKLVVPVASVEASVSKGPFHILSKEVTAGKTELLLEGTGGDLSFNWRRGTKQVVESGPSLTAQSSVEIRVESQLNVRAKATLMVSSVSEPLSEFDIQLPPGMKLARNARQPGLVMRALSATNASPDKGDIVRVTLNEPTEDSVQVDLSTTLARGVADGKFQAIGFKVLDAVQRGSVTVTSAKGWTAQPVETLGVTRVSPPPDSPLGTWQYAFENQPRSLLVQISPAKSRLHIQPTYVAHIVRGQVNLRAEFKCSLGGADIGSSLSIQLPGWTIRDATADRLDLSEVDLSEVNPLRIPLVLEGQDEREFTLVIDAALSIDDDAEQLSFEFPTLVNPASSEDPSSGQPLVDLQPINTTITTASSRLVIASADDIEVSPALDQIRGMTPVYTAPPTTLGLPPLQKAPLMFTDLVDDDAPQFTGELTYHSQAITADVQSLITISAAQIQVDQLLRHRISYVPANFLLLEAPLDLLQPDAQLQISLDDQPLNFSPVDLPTSIGRAALRIELPMRTIGGCELTATYNRPGANLEGEQALAVPLLGPLLSEGVTKHQVELIVDPALNLDGALPEPWRIDPSANRRVFVNSGAAQTADVQLRSQSQTQTDGTVVTRTWLQSWLQADARRDRAVFRARVDGDEVVIQLPSGVASDHQSIKAAVDGRQTPHRFEPTSRRTAIAIPAGDDEHVIEVWYSLTPQSWLARTSSEAPHIVDAIESGRSFWEILAPDSHQLVTGPERMTADMNWQWRNGVPQPLASQTTQNLERWIGASTQAPPPSGLKPYLFTTSGAIPESTIALMTFHRMILGVATGALLIGWCCLRWTWLRSPSSLMLWGILLLGVALSYPGLAWGLGQAVALGVALLAIGHMLQQNLSPNESELPIQPAPFPRRAATTTDDAVGTTATAALAMPTAESKS